MTKANEAFNELIDVMKNVEDRDYQRGYLRGAITAMLICDVINIDTYKAYERIIKMKFPY